MTASSTEQPDKEEELEEYVTGGGDCNAAPVCEGDPVPCAILAQQWETRCNLEMDYEQELADFKNSLSGVDDDGDGVVNDAELQEEDIEDLIDTSSVFEVSDLGSYSCPSPERGNLSSTNVSVELDYQPLCDLALGMRPAVIAVAAFLSAAILWRGSIA